MDITTTADQNAPATETKSVTGGELFVRCLENEGVEYIFGLSGEETIDVLTTTDRWPYGTVNDDRSKV